MMTGVVMSMLVPRCDIPRDLRRRSRKGISATRSLRRYMRRKGGMWSMGWLREDARWNRDVLHRALPWFFRFVEL